MSELTELRSRIDGLLNVHQFYLNKNNHKFAGETLRNIMIQILALIDGHMASNTTTSAAPPAPATPAQVVPPVAPAPAPSENEPDTRPVEEPVAPSSEPLVEPTPQPTAPEPQEVQPQEFVALPDDEVPEIDQPEPEHAVKKKARK